MAIRGRRHLPFRASTTWSGGQILSGFAGLWLVIGPVGAGPFKCLTPEGTVIYQQTACESGTQGGELVLPADAPDVTARAAGKKTVDLSLEGQLKAMEATRRPPAGLPAPETEHPGSIPGTRTNVDADPVKCDHYRAEVDRWERAVAQPYRDRKEQAQRERRLARSQAQADRYCSPD